MRTWPELILQLYSPENPDKTKKVNMFLGNIANIKTTPEW